MKSTYLRATRLLLAVAVILVAVGAGANAASPAEKADMAWQQLKRYIDAGPGLSQLSPEVEKGPGYLLVWETYARVLRRYGLQFYDNYPNDPRRLRWLPAAFRYHPRYWLTPAEAAQSYAAARKAPREPQPVIPMDEAARAEWETRYPALRAEFLASANVSETDRAGLLLHELFRRLQAQSGDAERSQLYAATADGRRFRQELQREILDLGNMAADWTSIDMGDVYLRLAANDLLDAYWLTGESSVAADYISQLGQSRSAYLNKFALGKRRIMSLTGTPMAGRFTALDGREIDFEKLRGKVVLIEYWDLGCAGCIAQMPKLKRLYEKYHDHGFEIIGFCSHSPEMSRKVEEFVAKRGLPWPQRLDPSLKEDYERYSFAWVSNLLLLDKNGKLVMHSGGPSEAQLDAAIRRQLELTPAS